MYLYWHNCGADRYLLRHETASKDHYEKLHPEDLFFERRMQCLWDLKEIGYRQEQLLWWGRRSRLQGILQRICSS